MSVPVQSDNEWISGTRARQRLRVTVAALYKLAARGLIQIQALPGETVKYSGADVERLAESQQQDA
jgi:hypothetical protein